MGGKKPRPSGRGNDEICSMELTREYDSLREPGVSGGVNVHSHELGTK